MSVCNQTLLNEFIQRATLPYCVIASRERNTWRAFNRDYQACGTNFVIPLETPPHEIAYFDDDGKRLKPNQWSPHPPVFKTGERIVEFFLFHDGCPPWLNVASLRRYLEAHALITTLEGRAQLVSFPDINWREESIFAGQE